MKKLFFLVAIATSLLSCQKERPGDYYQGDTLSFEYYATNLKPTLVSVIGSTATIMLNDANRTTFSVPVLNSSNSDGSSFILEAVFTPGQWVWSQSSGQYKPEDFNWNAASGFSATNCAAYFVARLPGDLTYHIYQGGAWGSQPSASGWISSFNAPRTVANRTWPVIGRVVKVQNGNNTYFTHFF